VGRERWEEAPVPGHDDLMVSRDRQQGGHVSILDRQTGLAVASGIGYSDSLAEAQRLAAAYVDKTDEFAVKQPREILNEAKSKPLRAATVRITARDAVKAGLITQQLADSIGGDTMVEVS
jgi:hypothetical protein